MRMALVGRGAGDAAETVVSCVWCGHTGIRMREPRGSEVGGCGLDGGGRVWAGRRATARGERRLQRKDLDTGDGRCHGSRTEGGWVETGKDGSEMWQRSTLSKVKYSSGPAVRQRGFGGAACESVFGGGGVEGMRACERR
jgi:hypothetical protein